MPGLHLNESSLILLHRSLRGGINSCLCYITLKSNIPSFCAKFAITRPSVLNCLKLDLITWYGMNWINPNITLFTHQNFSLPILLWRLSLYSNIKRIHQAKRVNYLNNIGSSYLPALLGINLKRASKILIWN